MKINVLKKKTLVKRENDEWNIFGLREQTSNKYVKDKASFRIGVTQEEARVGACVSTCACMRV